MTDQLARLLDPTPVSVFFDHFYGRQYLHARAASPERLNQAVGIDDIDRLLQSQQLPAAFFNVVKDGALAPLDDWSRTGHATRGQERLAVPERLLSLYLDGYTIIINKAYEALPALSAVSRRLSSELGFLVGGNIYLTPAGSKGFPRHGDPHDVLVLQLSGSKAWTVHPGPDVSVEVVLNAGDVLFIPRKMDHEARCQDSHSIHVSLGMNPTYEFQLIEELAAIASEDPAFQRPFSPRLPRPVADYDADFATRVKELLERTSVDSLIERRFRVLVDTTQRQGWAGRLSDVLRLAEITPDSVLCIRPGVITKIVPNGNSLCVHFAGNEVKVPVFLRSCLDRLLIEAPFAIRELQGLLTDPNKVELVRPFVRTGLLSIVRL